MQEGNKMTKEDAIRKLDKAISAIEKLPDGFEVGSVTLDCISDEASVRVENADGNALFNYAIDNELYHKNLEGEFRGRGGFHALATNGVELYQMG
jgi:hypothetical protein